jgi:hypothetical protein
LCLFVNILCTYPLSKPFTFNTPRQSRQTTPHAGQLSQMCQQSEKKVEGERYEEKITS